MYIINLSRKNCLEFCPPHSNLTYLQMTTEDECNLSLYFVQMRSHGGNDNGRGSRIFRRKDSSP